ncbi:hypothetical protein PIB30_088021 [Stylosanthes scabra]|uniref:Uncharacterized protein n=1 Tax=Stylosanthes scabra TaxID=79078 RepID=A0ABU6SU40_9FABA|nr:hypothetical protein [Stylosanthes scabra]
MENKLSAPFGDQSWSASGDSCRSSAGGECNRRRRKFVAPRYRCGTYAILFQSATTTLIGFSLVVRILRYFAWLDEYMYSFAVNEAANRAEVSEDMMKLEEKIAALEKMVAERTVGSNGSLPAKQGE